MEDRVITRVIEILEADPDFFVPVKKVWLTLQEEALALDIDLEGFRNVLAADERFEFAPGVDHRERFEVEGDSEFAEEMERQMEALGFFSGPRVKLASRVLSPEDVVAAMVRNLTRMNKALQSAWDARPGEDPDLDDQLLGLLAAGQKLEREIRKLVEQQKQEDPIE
jgi:hypothetical protein